MDPNSLTHYGVKGMKWGVRRTPAQLGHRTSSRRKKNGAVAAVGKAGSAAVKKVAGIPQAHRDKLVAKAMAPGSSDKALRKALPYMTDADIKKKMDRNALESKLAESNAAHKKGVSELSKTAQAIKKGSDLGDTEGVKKAKSKFMEEALTPMATAAGKAAGQYVLGKTADAAISLAAGKLGISDEAAKSIASQFKASMAEDFASAAAKERSKFSEKNTLGEEWTNEKNWAKEKKKAVEDAYAKAQKIQDDREEAEAYKQATKIWQDKQARNAEAKKQALNKWVADQQPKQEEPVSPKPKVKSPEERKAAVDRVKQTQQNAAKAARETAEAQRHADNVAKAKQLQRERFNKPKNEREEIAEKKRHEENKAQARHLQEERMYRVRKKR